MPFQNSASEETLYPSENVPDLGLPGAPAFHDTLTGLSNCALFIKQLELCLSRAEHKAHSLAILVVGLDRFKQVNDTYGYAAGDMVLLSATRRLSELGMGNCPLARLGGDTFALALENPENSQVAVNAAESIRARLSLPFSIEDEEIFLSASIGISLYPHQGEKIRTLIANAKKAMDQIKNHGRDNYAVFDPEHHQSRRSSRRSTLERALHHALEKNQLALLYQPQIDLESGEIRGVEALLRWHHPELGTISPAEFIPLAEESGLIHPISAWVLRNACAQNSAWHQEGYTGLRMAVNLSAQQFSRPGLDQLVHEVLQDTGLAPRWLELELTETIALQHIDDAISTLQKLKTMGVRIAIDDFGTGYSSLSYLKHFPVHSIKIDRSFINGITTHSSDAAITRAVIAMAQNLGVRVVAEGVESEKQLVFLRTYQCNEVQGYYFSPPLSARGASQLLLHHANKTALALTWSNPTLLGFPSGAS
ncbi:MAG: bifunctional diguanylate cyclase/phosphodiesterase [Sulfurimicrobium sp.]|nr:bifunctional diguanylate cyclase/phosphodiesterase [Sulfurimicrobium sp.]MDO9190274.1 bifunctional diguanylate cyclase/phosphodiesterase [Sulfurimicrobium sp.]MDP2197596.1 bifunctional diguanylate cyclase/phosphodiesterase [Sulfurimicrobium sp.]MDP3688456.1 bifunctional diguanylate cyclase/phosphodiesterase [Sulfurimicrobium sp.]MDZ7656627.1 bifunctional diguanylate cyclase/phosphodiesterase [Sulfurimicrobium sp.]